MNLRSFLVRMCAALGVGVFASALKKREPDYEHVTWKPIPFGAAAGWKLIEAYSGSGVRHWVRVDDSWKPSDGFLIDPNHVRGKVKAPRGKR